MFQQYNKPLSVTHKCINLRSSAVSIGEANLRKLKIAPKPPPPHWLGGPR